MDEASQVHFKDRQNILPTEKWDVCPLLWNLGSSIDLAEKQKMAK